jgi:exonuclease III
VVGGDLNAALRFDDLYTRGASLYGNLEWFSKAREAGWWNAHRKFHAGEQRTLFRPGKPDEHFQIDHLFTDKGTWTDLQRCEVLSVPFLGEFSDHAPLVLEVEA